MVIGLHEKEEIRKENILTTAKRNSMGEKKIVLELPIPLLVKNFHFMRKSCIKTHAC